MQESSGIKSPYWAEMTIREACVDSDLAVLFGKYMISIKTL